ncbi:unnamed protein product [Rotaria sp. Silwood2]|nr:unnamed protein product [Rotaria sp. Silwood2]CAF4365603.1 unnamed protein product [Rotaria sp. Silwood2]
MGAYSCAEELYTLLLDSNDENNQHNSADIYHQLKHINSEKGDYEAAFSNYKKALDIEENPCGPDDPSLATIYNNLDGKNLLHQSSLATTSNNTGSECYSMKDYLTVLSYYEQALTIQQNAKPLKNLDMATTYNQIGLVHHEMKDYSKALSFYQKSLELKLMQLHDNHKDLPLIYNNIAVAYRAMKDKQNALLYYTKVHEI